MKKILILILKFVGISHHDIYLLNSISHKNWIYKAFNPLDKKIPLQKFQYTKINQISDEDISFCQRIINAYDKTQSNDNSKENRSKEWSRIFNLHQKPLIDCLNRKDPKELAKLFSTFLRTQIVYGIDTGDLYNGSNWKTHSLKLLSDLTRLSEYLSISSAESGQGEICHIFDETLDKIFLNLENELGKNFDFPKICGAYGVIINNKLLTLQSVEYIYAAIRLKKDLSRLSEINENKKLDILEIGAGYGGFAYYIHNFLEKNFNSLSIIDLPIINTMQAYFLGKTLGYNNIALYGEDDIHLPSKIKIYPSTDYSNLGKVDIVFNQNSFAEIPIEESKKYLDWIIMNANYFFSYNHESLLKDRSMAVITVPELTKLYKNLNLISREISWMRPGYVHEIYKKE